MDEKRKRWFQVSLAALAIPTLIVTFLISGFFEWSPLNCWHDDVDINTGRVRHTRFLLYCAIADRTEDSWLSLAVPNPDISPDWRHVNTFSPGVHHSPHYQFQGAIHQIQTLEVADGTTPFEPEARRKVASKLLASWQLTGSDVEAGEYVEKVAQTAITLNKAGASVFRSSDLPPD